MIRQMNRWCWMCGCALLLLQGCKTKTAADVPTLVPFELLDAGEEPRAPLRYAIADGTTTTVTTTFTVTPEKEGATTLSMSGLQSLEIKAILGPAQNRGDEIFYDYELVDAKAVAAPGASREAREDIRQSAAFLKGAGATASINDRGKILSTQMNQRTRDVPVRTLLAIINTQFALSLIVLPKEEVGVGARWLLRNMIAVYGFQMEQTLAFTLVERLDDDNIVLDVEFERSGERQVVEFPDDETLVEVEASRTTGRGRIQLDLQTFRSNARATGHVTDSIVILEDGKREKREVNEDFKIRVTSSSAVP